MVDVWKSLVDFRQSELVESIAVDQLVDYGSDVGSCIAVDKNPAI